MTQPATPAQSPGLREALDNSQSLFAMFSLLGSADPEDLGIRSAIWKDEGLSKLIDEQMSENRQALAAQSPGLPPSGVSEEERHAIGHARHLVQCSSDESPECCFDYTLVKDLLRVIDRSASVAGEADDPLADFAELKLLIDEYNPSNSDLVRLWPKAAPTPALDPGTVEALTPTNLVNDLLSACDPSNWDADRNQGDYFKGLRDAYEHVQELTIEYQTAMYAWTKRALASPAPEETLGYTQYTRYRP